MFCFSIILGAGSLKDCPDPGAWLHCVPCKIFFVFLLLFLFLQFLCPLRSNNSCFSIAATRVFIHILLAYIYTILFYFFSIRNLWTCATFWALESPWSGKFYFISRISGFLLSFFSLLLWLHMDQMSSTCLYIHSKMRSIFSLSFAVWWPTQRCAVEKPRLAVSLRLCPLTDSAVRKFKCMSSQPC